MGYWETVDLLDPDTKFMMRLKTEKGGTVRQYLEMSKDWLELLQDGTKTIKIRQQKSRDVRILKKHIQLFIDNANNAKLKNNALLANTQLINALLANAQQLGDDGLMRELFKNIKRRGTKGITTKGVKDYLK